MSKGVCHRRVVLDPWKQSSPGLVMCGRAALGPAIRRSATERWTVGGVPQVPRLGQIGSLSE